MYFLFGTLGWATADLKKQIRANYWAPKKMDKYKTKTLNILNPYTGEIEEFEVKREGLTSDLNKWNDIMDIDEPIRFDDERLEAFNYNLDRQYLEHKRDKEKELEAEKKKKLFDEALRNDRRNS